RHQQSGGKIVGEPLDALLAFGELAFFLGMFGRHVAPGEKVEKLMGHVERTPTGGFAAIDDDGVERPQPAGCARYPRYGVDMQDQGIELLLEYGRQARCWYVTQAERARYRIAFGRGFLERAFPVQANLHEQGIDRFSLEAAQMTIGGDPAAGTLFERFQAIRRRGLAPGE